MAKKRKALKIMQNNFIGEQAIKFALNSAANIWKDNRTPRPIFIYNWFQNGKTHKALEVMQNLLWHGLYDMASKRNDWEV